MSRKRTVGLRFTMGLATVAVGTTMAAGPAHAQLPEPPVDDPIDDVTDGDTPDLSELACSLIELDVSLTNLVITTEDGSEFPLQDLSGQAAVVPTVDDPTGDLPGGDLPGDSAQTDQLPDPPGGDLPITLDTGTISLNSDPLAGEETEDLPASLLLEPVDDADVSESTEQLKDIPYGLSILVPGIIGTDSGTAEQGDATAPLTELKSAGPIELDVQRVLDVIQSGLKGMSMNSLLLGTKLVDTEGNPAGKLTSLAPDDSPVGSPTL
ncbi:hypothetical protein [Haloglycomyces albus]|uniref:hypothetical protein n=1 Tax=Haloglycomyces albus TaxID=526067 RepID=UPI00046D59DC|nr:hypothetical protein [Haloglycomyces albus]